MGQTWGLGLPELGLCPGEEVGDSAVVGSLVPLIPEDLCEELKREREGEGEREREQEREKHGKVING